MNRIKLAFTLSFIMFAFSSNAALITLSGQHDTYNGLPFGLNGEYQQVFDANLFTSTSTLSRVGFSATNSSFNADVVIKLGLTEANSTTGLDSVLANNPFSSMISVYNASSVFTGLNTADPDAFDMVFDFTNNFDFDPNGGLNLLISISVSNLTAGTAVSRSFDSFSPRAFNNSSSVGSDGGGVRAQFETVEVSTPSMFSILLLGLLSVLSVSRRTN